MERFIAAGRRKKAKRWGKTARGKHNNLNFQSGSSPTWNTCARANKALLASIFSTTRQWHAAPVFTPFASPV